MILSKPPPIVSTKQQHSFYGAKPTSSVFSPPLKQSSFISNLKKQQKPTNMSSKQASSWIIPTSGASGRINALFSVHAWKSIVVLIHAVLVFVFGGRKEKTTVRVPAKMVTWKSGEVSVRRGLAIRRVLEDDDGGDCVREYFVLSTCNGGTDTLFAQSWTPVSGLIRGLVVLMHGLNEHRYNDFAKQLNANGFKVYGMDWIGHGGSDGLHAYVPSLDYAVADLKSFLDKVLRENPGLPCFCFGHSTGGAIVLKTALDPRIENRLAGVVLTSPAVGVQPSHPIFAVLAPILSFLLPRFQLSAANKKGVAVSRDPAALVAKYSDPLVYTGSIRVRTGYEILRITTFLQQNLTKVKVPFLVLHGSDDSVTDPEASQKLYNLASSNDKTIKLLDGLLHDLLFEPEAEKITKDIISWLNFRV